MHRKKKEHENAKHGHMIQWNQNGHIIYIFTEIFIHMYFQKYKQRNSNKVTKHPLNGITSIFVIF